MTTHSQPRRQSDAIALQGPDDIDRQTAALLRQVLNSRHEDINADAIVDDATITRVMNSLRAKGLFDPPAAQQGTPVASGATPQAPTLPGRPHAASSSGAAGLRVPAWLWAAAALLALATVWMLTQPVAPVSPDGPPGLVTKGLANSAVQSVQVSAPDPEAARLVQLLGSLGVRADVQAVGDARLVRAQVAAASLANVGSALTQQGLVLPYDGRLAVLFEARRP